MKKARKDQIVNLISTEIEKAKTSAGRALTGIAKKDYILKDNHGDNEVVKDGIAGKYLDKLNKLKQEVMNFSEEENTQINVGSFCLVKYKDGSMLEVCMVKNPVSMPSFLFLSKNSSLGSALLGKVEGDTFAYKPNKQGKEFSGVIIRVE